VILLTGESLRYHRQFGWSRHWQHPRIVDAECGRSTAHRQSRLHEPTASL